MSLFLRPLRPRPLGPCFCAGHAGARDVGPRPPRDLSWPKQPPRPQFWAAAPSEDPGRSPRGAVWLEQKRGCTLAAYKVVELFQPPPPTAPPPSPPGEWGRGAGEGGRVVLQILFKFPSQSTATRKLPKGALCGRHPRDAGRRPPLGPAAALLRLSSEWSCIVTPNKYACNSFVVELLSAHLLPPFAGTQAGTVILIAVASGAVAAGILNASPHNATLLYWPPVGHVGHADPVDINHMTKVWNAQRQRSL